MEYFTVYLIQTFSIISAFFDISYFFQGLEEYGITVIRNAIIKLIGAVAVFLFIKNQNDLALYVIIQIIINLGGNLSLWIGLRGRVNRKYFHRFKIGKDARILAELFVPVISVQMYFSVDKVMLGIFDTTKIENGYYEQALKIIRICQTIITSLGSVLIPSVSRMIVKGDKKQVTNTITSSIRLGLCLSISMSLGIIAIADVFTPWFYGSEYVQAGIIMMFLAPLLIFSSISNVLSNGILIPTNCHNYVSISTITAAVLNVALNAILIPQYGGVGAAVASSASELLVLILSIFFTRKYFHMSEIVRDLFRYSFAGTIMLVALLLVKNSMAFLGLTVQMVIMIGLGVIVYFVALIVLEDKMCIDILKILKLKILKKN